MTYRTITLEFADDVATLTLAGGQSGNPLGTLGGEELSHALALLSAMPSLRLLVLRGSGKAFCVGGNLVEFTQLEDFVPSIRRMVIDFHGACAAIANLDIPVVCVVQGAVAGAGLALLALSDHVIASTKASFTYAYPGIGFSSDGGLTWLLPKIMGLRNFQRFYTEGRSFSAAEALECGLVSALVDPTELQARADEAIARFASGPTRAYGAIRKLAFDGFSAPYAAHLMGELEAISDLAASQDAQSAIRSVLQGDQPQFLGK